MNIVNLLGEPVQACCTFDCCGFEISISTIGKLHNKVLVKNDVGFTKEFDTVEEAIRWLNS